MEVNEAGPGPGSTASDPGRPVRQEPVRREKEELIHGVLHIALNM